MTISHGEPTARELLTAYQQKRDPEVFRQRVVRHHGLVYGLVYGLARRMLASPHASEDVVQITFLVLANDEKNP